MNLIKMSIYRNYEFNKLTRTKKQTFYEIQSKPILLIDFLVYLYFTPVSSFLLIKICNKI